MKFKKSAASTKVRNISVWGYIPLTKRLIYICSQEIEKEPFKYYVEEAIGLAEQYVCRCQ